MTAISRTILTRILLVFAMLGGVIMSCTDLDEVNHRLDDLEQDVHDLQTAVEALQEAYDAGKIVTRVTPIDTDNGGWDITFSDGSHIMLYNGADGKDGRDGNDGKDGADGKDGHDGKDGNDGVDGKDGNDGKDGRDGQDGRDGRDGDAFFASVEMGEGYVVFTLMDGRTFRFAMMPDYVAPRLTAMSFSAHDNPRQLVGDVSCTILGDSVVECWVPHIMEDKMLRPSVAYEGDSVVIDGQRLTPVAATDFGKPRSLRVYSAGLSRNYTVFVHAFTGLPVMWIETKGRAAITSKTVYQRAAFRLAEDVRTRAAGEVVEDSVNIRGRGNSTWEASKKPYRLKFDHGVSLIDEPKDKSWVLIANHYDKTMLRQKTAFDMGEMSNLDYTPHSHFVELILNGRYNGTYLLCDKLKTGKHRVNVGDDGYILEVDAKAASTELTFKVPHLARPINIKEPDGLTTEDEGYLYVKEYVTKCDSALYSAGFADPETGWKKWMDMDSFVDWYLINEIARNNDAVMYTSCYMNLKRGGKLKMGPLWDFDIAFGNVNYNKNFQPEGYYIKGAQWFSQMFKDPAFVARVKERFDYFYSRRDDILMQINENADYLKLSVQENENKWHTFYTYTWPNYNIYGSYQNEVQQMKDWIVKRFEWLKQAYAKL